MREVVNDSRIHELEKMAKNYISFSLPIFTITAQILARSLANFYRQLADRPMNL